MHFQQEAETFQSLLVPGLGWLKVSSAGTVTCNTNVRPFHMTRASHCLESEVLRNSISGRNKGPKRPPWEDTRLLLFSRGTAQGAVNRPAQIPGKGAENLVLDERNAKELGVMFKNHHMALYRTESEFSTGL